MKKIFLASKAKDLETIEKIRTFVGGFEGKKIAYIPTAVNGDKPRYDWRDGESAKLVKNLGAEITYLELESEAEENIYKVLNDTDIIWVAGGMGGYLMYWLTRTELNIEIPKLIEKGKIYVGSSAGSWVCSKKLSVADWFIGEPEPGGSLIPGMGLVDFEIYPHYQDDLLSDIKKHWKEGELYLLKDGEAITIVGDKLEILGEKRLLKNGDLAQ